MAVTPEFMTAHEVLDDHYGVGTSWEEPNEHGEAGFTRAQVETIIDSDDIATLIAEGITRDRAKRATALPVTPTAPAAEVIHGIAVPDDARFARFGKYVAAILGANLEWDGGDILEDVANQAVAMLRISVGDQDAKLLAFWRTIADRILAPYKPGNSANGR